jgi:hypothetical protein
MADKSSPTRRLILTALPAAAIGIGAILPAAAAAEPDAELIALVRAALAADEVYGDFATRCDEGAAQQENREVRPEDEAALEAASDVYAKLRLEIFSRQPKTVRGIRAIFEFMKHDPFFDDIDIEAFVDAMLASPALSVRSAKEA